MEFLHAAHLAPIFTAGSGAGDPIAFAGIAGGLFAAAFVGGFAHCAPMCGPFVLMQVAGQDQGAPSLRRLAAGALPGYHLGRLTTYVALGIVSGGLGGTLISIMPFRWVAITLLMTAALSFLLQGLGGVARRFPLPGLWTAGPRFAERLVRLAAPIVRPGFRPAGYRLGLVLGLLPCGFLYSALVASAATGGALTGGLAMAVFALGTIPALAAVGILGTAVLLRWRRVAAALAAPIFLVNGVTLGGLALRMIG